MLITSPGSGNSCAVSSWGLWMVPVQMRRRHETFGHGSLA